VVIEKQTIESRPVCFQSMKTEPVLSLIVVSSWIPPLLVAPQMRSCHAFAPSVHQGIRKSQELSCNRLNSRQSNERPVGSSSTGIVAPFRPTHLTRHYMVGSSGNLLDRLSRVVRSKVNLESPEKGIAQAMEDLKVTLEAVRAGLYTVLCKRTHSSSYCSCDSL
jgi:hypothetical protein